MRPLLDLVVSKIETFSPTLRRLTLRSADGRPLPAVPPGGHLSMILNAGDRILHNTYSIIGSVDDRNTYQVVVRRIPQSRGGSAYIHEVLREGDSFTASAPDSHFSLIATARRHLLIGGGIGITPMLSFLHTLRRMGVPHALHQFVRRDEASAFEALLDRHRESDTTVHAGSPTKILPAILARQPLGTHLYMCGPTGMMAAVRNSALEMGWPDANIHAEDFGSFSGTPFRLKLSRSGREVDVDAHESMLEAIERAGGETPSLCRGGACGMCLTRVLDGTPDHRDHYLDPAEQAAGDVVMPCVSRSRTPHLTIDV